MNETIVVEMADILQRTCLYQGLSVLIGILGIGLWYFRKKLFFPIVMMLMTIYGYLSANDFYREQRDERLNSGTHNLNHFRRNIRNQTISNYSQVEFRLLETSR